jgi:hypothetical protein
MFAGETKIDKQDLYLHAKIGCWIAVEWNEGICRPPKDIPYGTHLATFVIGQYGSEIKGVNICWLYSENRSRFYRVGNIMEGIEGTWIFKYSTLKKFKLMDLDQSSIQVIGLPDLSDNLHKDVPGECFKIRPLSALNPFRHPGYPDDVQVTTCPDFKLPESKIEFCGEQVWVRLNKMITDKHFAGTLLNNTAFTGWKEGEQVNVNLIPTSSGSMLYCAK